MMTQPRVAKPPKTRTPRPLPPQPAKPEATPRGTQAPAGAESPSGRKAVKAATVESAVSKADRPVTPKPVAPVTAQGQADGRSGRKAEKPSGKKTDKKADKQADKKAGKKAGKKLDGKKAGERKGGKKADKADRKADAKADKKADKKAARRARVVAEAAAATREAAASEQTGRIVVRDSDVHGKGVFATAEIGPGEVLIEYKGELISWPEALRRHPHDPSQPNHTFYFHIDDGHVIDGNVQGNDSRWINHACEPNCEADEQGRQVFIRTLRPLMPGEELFYDYGLIIDAKYTKKLKKEFECRCGFPACRGTLLAPKN